MAGLARLVGNLSAQVDVSGGEVAQVDVTVESSFGAGDLLFLGGIDMVDGLSFLDERSQQQVEIEQLLFGQRDAQAGAFAQIVADGIGDGGRIEELGLAAAVLGWTGVADIGEAQWCRAFIPDEVRADGIALAAGRAAEMAARFADTSFPTDFPVRTVVFSLLVKMGRKPA